MNHADHSWQDCPDLNPPKPAALFPTPTRLALLREVYAGNVLEGITPDTDGHTWLLREPDKPLKVCARIAEMLKAGWVVQDEAFWRVTVTGKAILEAAER